MLDRPVVKVVRKHEKGAEYIGRGSPLGNPFVLKSEADRDSVCDSYEVYFDKMIAEKNPVILNELRRLFKIAKSTGELKLGCFCEPKRCHGDTIKRFLDSKLELLYLKAPKSIRLL